MQKLPDISICGQIDFSSIAFKCKQAGVQFTHILSIWDTGSEYEDYTRKIFPGSKIQFAYFDDDLSNPSSDDIERCLEWGSKLPLDSKILIHCHAGLSRSPAIALGVLYGMYGDVDTCIQELRRVRPQAIPNRHIVQLIDYTLKLDDQLIKAVQNTFYA